MSKINQKSKVLWLIIALLIAGACLLLYMLLEYRGYKLNAKLPFIYPLVIISLIVSVLNNYNFYRKGFKSALSFGQTRKEVYKSGLKNTTYTALLISLFVLYDLVATGLIFSRSIVLEDYLFPVVVFMLITISSLLGIVIGLEYKKKYIMIIYFAILCLLYFIKGYLFTYSLYIVIGLAIMVVVLIICSYRNVMYINIK